MLTKEAQNFINEHCRVIPDVVCPSCKFVISTKPMKEQYDDAPLYKYQLRDGGEVKEVIWLPPYTCLEINGKRHFEWE